MTPDTPAKTRYAAALIPWSSPGDRFMRAGYRDALPLPERLQRAVALGVLDGVELRFPYEVNAENAAEVKRQLSDAGLSLAALGTSISIDRRFGKGALTSRDPAVRGAAIAHVRAGMDVCAALGGERIYFFLGQDGCDYALEVDYEDAWNWMVEGVREIASHRRDVEVCLEYKPFEPRRHIFLSDVGTALHLVREVNLDHVGVVLDMGHALIAGENLGESVWLLHRANRLAFVHFTDNYGAWDDDMIVGSVHLMPFVEAIYWLKRVGYAGWYSLDLFPYREDPDVTVSQSINFLKRLDALIEDIGLEKITALLQHGDGALSLREVMRRALGVA